MSRSAWQRQPPKSSSWRPSGQLRQGSCIQSVPRKRVNASDSCQIHSSERSFTLANSRPGIVAAAWHGSASPLGATIMVVVPQPPMHGFGRSSNMSGSTQRTVIRGPTRSRKRCTASSPRSSCSRVGISACSFTTAHP